MTADTITAIKKALEKVYVGGWYISGVKTNGLSVVHNAADSSMFGITAETFEAEYVVAANPVAVSELISTLESLQRENERVTALVSSSEAERVRSCSGLMMRAEAAEAKVKRLTYLLEKVAPPQFFKSWLPPHDYEMIRAALSSTGDTHGN